MLWSVKEAQTITRLEELLWLAGGIAGILGVGQWVFEASLESWVCSAFYTCLWESTLVHIGFKILTYEMGMLTTPIF